MFLLNDLRRFVLRTQRPHVLPDPLFDIDTLAMFFHLPAALRALSLSGQLFFAGKAPAKPFGGISYRYVVWDCNNLI